MDETLKKIRIAYYEAGRPQPSEYDPSWESLPIQLREAFIHVLARWPQTRDARGTRQAALNKSAFGVSALGVALRKGELCATMPIEQDKHVLPS
jgi:hypothetical protein